MSAAAALTPDRPAWGRTPAGRMSERFLEPEEHEQAPVVWTRERASSRAHRLDAHHGGGRLAAMRRRARARSHARAAPPRPALQAGLTALSGSLLSARERLRVTPWTRARDEVRASRVTIDSRPLSSTIAEPRTSFGITTAARPSTSELGAGRDARISTKAVARVGAALWHCGQRHLGLGRLACQAYRRRNQSTVRPTAAGWSVGSNGPNTRWNFEASETNGRSNW